MAIRVEAQTHTLDDQGDGSWSGGTSVDTAGWTETMGFEVGDIGARVTEFEAQGETRYQNTQIKTGAQAAECSIKQGRSYFGKWGGVFQFPSGVGRNAAAG